MFKSQISQIHNLKQSCLESKNNSLELLDFHFVLNSHTARGASQAHPAHMQPPWANPRRWCPNVSEPAITGHHWLDSLHWVYSPFTSSAINAMSTVYPLPTGEVTSVALHVRLLPHATPVGPVVFSVESTRPNIPHPIPPKVLNHLNSETRPTI